MIEYPIFDVPLLGGSGLIAVVAIVHVFISHFSVGSGFLMAAAERRAIREGDTDTIAFLKKYSWLVLLVPYVLGTTTGVGIWFTIALIAPRAVSILIHQFVWDWAIEWVLFIIEGLAIFVYVLRWDKMDPNKHNHVGWIFAYCSLGTLLIINAILSFMLTPGSWQPFDAGFMNYKGILNPTYLPTAAARFLISLGLAGVAAIVLVAWDRKISDRVRNRIVPLAYKFIVPAIICIPLGVWTFSQLAERAQVFLKGGAPAMILFLGFGMAAFLTLFLAASVSLLRKDYSVSSLGGVLLFLLAFIAFGAMEFVREGVRKPYVIEGFMYSTGVTDPAFEDLDVRGNLTQTQRAGILSVAAWAVPPGKEPSALTDTELGEAVFKAGCLRCHSVDGYNAIRPLVRGWSRQTVREMLDRLDEIKPAMPPFPGTDREKEALSEFLLSLNTDSNE